MTSNLELSIGGGGLFIWSLKILLASMWYCKFPNLKNSFQFHHNQIENVYEDKKPDGCVRFVCISDTHNKTDHLVVEDLLPDGDVLLHGGDFTG